MTLGSKFYWTDSIPSSNIEVMPRKPKRNQVSTYLGCKQRESSMKWTTPPRIGSKNGTAPAVAALIAISVLFAPPQAFATPPPLTAPSYAVDATKHLRETNYTNIGPTDAVASDKPDKSRDDDHEYDDDETFFY
jgi:hypothetical protein